MKIFKNKLLVASPYVNKIGGTEIEAISTAIFFYENANYDEVNLFSPTSINKRLVDKLVGERKIVVFTYPKYLSNNICEYINRFFFKVGIKIKITEFLYWKMKSISFSTFFILTFSNGSYFFPILRAVSSSKRTICKITMGYHDVLSNKQVYYYKKFNKIIVFNKVQKEYWQIKYKFENIVPLDIMIPNEYNLLSLNQIDSFVSDCLVFGFLGRISEEKNIEDMILLLDFLNNKNNYKCKLIIQGEGETHYTNKLKNKIKALNLSSFIEFINSFIEPMLTHQFMDKIDVFLVTSILEGGPITALEAAAAGRIVMGYDVGAMRERFSNLPYCINKNFEELALSAKELILLDDEHKIQLALNFRDQYVSNLNNRNKGKQLLNYFNT